MDDLQKNNFFEVCYMQLQPQQWGMYARGIKSFYYTMAWLEFQVPSLTSFFDSSYSFLSLVLSTS